MSRSRHSGPRYRPPRIYRGHKRERHAVHEVLENQARHLAPWGRRTWHVGDDPGLQVLADELETLGQLKKAEALRSGEDLVLPRAPSGWNSRLRW
ncbi:MAG: hypothetical protein U0228_10700 [Myxococcaceae bacterium]